jgi:ABC-type phosphate transport system permease subunit
MHTIVPLRVANMVGCMFFVAYGALSGNVGAFVLYLLLLPINAIRLRQMLNLIKRAIQTMLLNPRWFRNGLCAG